MSKRGSFCASLALAMAAAPALFASACGGARETNPLVPTVEAHASSRESTTEVTIPRSSASAGARPAATSTTTTTTNESTTTNGATSPASTTTPTEPRMAMISPRFVARHAYRFADAMYPNSVRIRLVERDAGSCEVAASLGEDDRVDLVVEWKPGAHVVSQSIRITNGQGRKTVASIEILTAPAKKGAHGRLRVVPVTGANVEGGEVDVEPCD